MDDQRFQEGRQDGFVDGAAMVGLLIVALLFAAAIVVFLI